jgi:hypothetical protein
MGTLAVASGRREAARPTSLATRSLPILVVAEKATNCDLRPSQAGLGQVDRSAKAPAS